MLQCLRSGDPIPDAIQNAPDLLPGLALFFNAYWEVQSDRPVGFEPGRIPWSTAVKYAEMHGFSEDQRDDLIYHFGQMDEVFLAHVRSKG